MLKLVPFHQDWITNPKSDLKAIYRRPQLVEDEDTGEMVPRLDDKGQPVWDIATPLPVKQHTKWAQKGFEYITLANRESLHMAAQTGTLIGGSVRDYDQHATGGPWNYRKYAAGVVAAAADAAGALRSDVERFGPDVAEELQRRTQPHFKLPESMRKAAKTKASA